MERLLLCALVLLRPLDAADTARTTRDLPLCPEGKGEKPQHLDVPADQGTTWSSLRKSLPLWPTDGSLETNDSVPKEGKGPGGDWPLKKNTSEYWSAVSIDLLIIVCALLLSVLIGCCYASVCGRTPHSDPSECERLWVQTTSPSLEGERDYQAITDVGAEGQDSKSAEDDDDDYDYYDYDDYDFDYDDDDDDNNDNDNDDDSDSDSDYDNREDDNDDKPPLLWIMDVD